MDAPHVLADFTRDPWGNIIRIDFSCKEQEPIPLLFLEGVEAIVEAPFSIEKAVKEGDILQVRVYNPHYPEEPLQENLLKFVLDWKCTRIDDSHPERLWE